MRLTELKDDLFIGEEEGEAILFDPATMNTVWINDTALEIIKRLKEGKEKRLIIKELMEIFADIAEENLQTDFEGLMAALKANGFLKE